MTADQNANRTTGETEGIDQEPTDVGETDSTQQKQAAKEERESQGGGERTGLDGEEGAPRHATDVEQLEHEERERFDKIDRVIDKADSDASDNHRDAQRDP